MPAVIVSGEFQLIVLYRGMTMQMLSEMQRCIQIMVWYMKKRDWGIPKPDIMPFDKYVCSPLILPGEWNPPFIVAPLDPSMTPADFKKLAVCKEKGSVILPMALTHHGEVEAQCEKHGLDLLMPDGNHPLSERDVSAYFSYQIPRRA